MVRSFLRLEHDRALPEPVGDDAGCGALFAVLLAAATVTLPNSCPFTATSPHKHPTQALSALQTPRPLGGPRN